MLDIEKKFSEIAEHLTGKKCLVRWREPVWLRADDVPMAGACYRTKSNTVVIDVNPGMGKDALYTLLHEIGHVKSGLRDMAPSDYWKAAPCSLKLSPSAPAGLKASSLAEDKADEWARRWIKSSLNWSWRYHGDTLLEKQLAVLAVWPADDALEAMKMWEEQKEQESIQRAVEHMRRA